MLVVAATLGMAMPALAGVTYTVNASMSDQSPLSAATPNQQLILDITVRTDDNALGVAGSVNDYDNTVIQLDAAGSSLNGYAFAQFCFPSAGCLNGLVNQVGTAITFGETTIASANGGQGGVEAEFLAALGLSAAGGNGSIDEGVITTVTGDPQFRVVYNVIGATGTTTTLQVGTFAEYLDGYTGTVDSVVTNAPNITITVPEPSAIASSAAALASIFGVVVVRRRLL